MTSTLQSTRSANRTPSATQRLGYTLAVILNGIMLWVAHQLLDWEWPGFLTEDFEELLPLISISFAVSMVVNVCFLWRDSGWFRALADTATSAIGLAVALQTWAVFPFDFTGYEQDWSWLLRLGVGVGIAGTAIAVIVNVVKLGRHLVRRST